jgi:chemotaxis protein histidine kinase CheA
MQLEDNNNYETMNSGNTQTATHMTLAANPIVEKCLAKMANDVTAQVRDKLIDIIIAVLARECEDFDGESVRRLIVAELETTPLKFELEKRAASSGKKTLKTPKTPKAVELDAEGNPVKKVKAPKEPKEKQPKEKQPKAPKVALTDEEREARDAAKKVEREAAKEARRAEKEAEKETAKLAKEAEKEAAKLAKEAEKEAAKLAKEAAKEAVKLAKPAKEQRLPIPWCGARIPDRCEALRSYHGLFAQCTADSTETSAFCPSCEKTGAAFGTCAMRASCGLFDYTDPKGKKCVRLANVVDKFEVEGGIDAFIAEAAKYGITIPAEHLEKEVKMRGRPKSSSPRARPTKIATSDTGSGSETETDDEEHQAAAKKQQQRKKVTKTASAASAEDAAPKKRGRPAKAKEAAPAPVDDLISDLVASAKKSSTPVAAPAPSSQELSEDEVVQPVAVAPKPKLVAPRPKPAKVERKVVEIDGEKFWVEQYNGAKIIVRCSDNMAFDATTGDHLGEWDNKQKTVIECADESDEE